MSYMEISIQDVLKMGKYDVSALKKDIINAQVDFEKAKKTAKDNLDNLKTPIGWFPKCAGLTSSSTGLLCIQGGVVPQKEYNEYNVLPLLDDMIKKIYALNNLFHILREVTNAERTRYFESLTEDYFNFCYYYNTILSIYLDLDRLKRSLINTKTKKIEEIKSNAERELAKKGDAISALKDSINQKLAESNSFCLKDSEINFKGAESLSVVLGATCDDLSAESKDFLVNTLGYNAKDIEKLTYEPISIDLTQNGGSVLVKTNSANMSSVGISEFVENIILSYLNAVGASKVKLAGIESAFNTRISAVLSEFARTNNYIAYDKDIVAKKDSDIQNLLDSLVNDINEREMAYSNNGYSNIYDYNKENIDNEHKTILLFISDYPTSLESRSGADEVISKINYILSKGKDMGVYLVALENDDEKLYTSGSRYSECLPMLNEALFGVVITNFNVKDKTYLCGRQKLTYNIRENGFNLKNYLSNLAKEEKEENRFYLSKLLEEIKRKKIKYSADDSKIKIPVGKINNEIYNFVTDSSSAPSAMVLGGSGSGKSSFLHTLILSAASLYSPDELEFYVADFKNTDKTTDGPTFTVYQKDSEYYIPHIKYMSTIGSIENTRDILDVIDTLKNKRAKLFRQINGCQDVVGYNSSPQVKSGKLPRMSRIIFIIDEFNNMLGENESNPELETIKADLKRMLRSALTTIRAFGICILFSGQNNSLDGTSSSQVNTKILLKDARHSFNIGESYLKAFNTKGNAIFHSGASTELVKTVYTGDFSSNVQSDIEEKRKIIKNIQNQYNDKDYVQNYARDNKEVSISSETELFNKIEEDRESFEALNGYTVYLGRSFGADEPACIYFSTQSDTQYSIVAPLTQLSKIERNVMLGFLTTTIVLDKSKANKGISYCKIEDNESDSANCLDDFIDKYEELDDYFDILTNPAMIAKKINALYEEYNNRENRVSRSREPMLLVINNIKRLKEKISSLKTTAKVITPKLSPEKEAMKQRLLKQQAEGKDVSFLLAQLEDSTGYFGGENDFSDIKVGDVIEKLKYLIENGRRYSIFVVVTGNSYDMIKDYSRQNRFAITNSNLSDIKNTCCSIVCEKPQRVFKNGLETIETDKPCSLNVKLYNYALKNESAFWNRLIGLINNRE